MTRRAPFLLLSLALVCIGAAAAGAATGQVGAVSVSVSPTSGIVDGQTVSIHASANAGTVIYQLRAHLCTAGPDVRTNYDFGYEGKRCANVAVGKGDAEQSVDYGAGVASAELDSFRVGAGSVRWVNDLGYPATIECGSGHPCDLVVRIQVTDDTLFFNAPVCYDSACPASPAPAGAPAAARSSSASHASSAAAHAGNGATRSGGERRATASGEAVRTAPVASAATAPSKDASSDALRMGLVGIAGLVVGGAVVAVYDRRRLRTAAVIGAAALAVLLLLSGCSSSGHSGSAASTTTLPRGSATIASFVVPASVRCSSAPSTTVKISYDVRGARGQALVIDGLSGPALPAARATVSERVHCDGVAHTVALVATDPHGASTSQVKYLRTLLPT